MSDMFVTNSLNEATALLSKEDGLPPPMEPMSTTANGAAVSPQLSPLAESTFVVVSTEHD